MLANPMLKRTLLACTLAATVLVCALAPKAAQAADLSTETHRLEKVADPDTSSLADRLFDTTGAGGETLLSTEQAGRIWVDKSVYASNADAEAAGLPGVIDNEQRNFLVGLSALSSAASIRQETGVAHDVVLVVNLNAILTQFSYKEASQAEHLVDALDGAIGRLMDEGGAGTRVALIGYAYETTVLMPLDRYMPDEHGRYLSYRSEGDPGSATGYLDVVATGTGGGTGASMKFDSGAYLQRALVQAGDILEPAASDATGPRDAALIVMGTESPLTANTDIEAAPAIADSDPDAVLGLSPTNNVRGFGTDAAFATLLTLEHQQQRIDGAYRAAGGQASVSTVGFQTTGMAAYTLGTARDRARASVTSEGYDLSDNMGEAAAAYAQAAADNNENVTLPLIGSSTSGLTPVEVTLPVEQGLLDDTENGPAFTATDSYYLARSGASLRSTFGTAVDTVLGIEYLAPTPADDNDPTSTVDRVTARDDIGQGMLVERVEGILYQGELLDGAGCAEAITRALADPYDFEAGREMSHVVDGLTQHFGFDFWNAHDLFQNAQTDRQLFFESEDSFSNKATFYVDADHRAVADEAAQFTFATQAEIDAITDGSWKTDSASDVHGRVQAAADRGATAVCEVYFYIGDYKNQYTGADVDLYDFIVMVETDLDTGKQELLLSVPAASIPARLMNVTVGADGSATMSVDADSGDDPLRLVYEIAPNASATALLDRFEAGETVTDEELEATFGELAGPDGTGTRRLYASAFSGSGDEAQAGTLATGYAAETNAYYSFSRDTPLYRLADGIEIEDGTAPSADQLVPLTEMPRRDDVCYYYKTSYEASLAPGTTEAAAVEQTQIMPYVVEVDEGDLAAHFARDGEGQIEVLAGTPKRVVPFLLSTHEKHPNATASAPYSELLNVEEYAESGYAHLSALLGNNGAFSLVPRDPATASIAGSVVLNGRDAQNGEFTFQLFEADGTTPVTVNGEPVVAHAAQAADGAPAAFELSVPALSGAGTYTYVLRQVVPDPPADGMEYDDKTVLVTIDVELGNSGAFEVAGIRYSVDGSPVESPQFVNTFTPDDGGDGGGTTDPGDGDGGSTTGPDDGGGTDPDDGNGTPDAGKDDASGGQASSDLPGTGDAAWAAPLALALFGGALGAAGMRRLQGSRRRDE